MKRGLDEIRTKPLLSNWLPGIHDLQTRMTVIPMTYAALIEMKSIPLEKAVNIPQKHIIHKAIEWKRMLDEGIVGSMKEIAAKEGLTRARATQVTNLLKLPEEMQELLSRLDDPKEIKRYSERKLRHRLSGLQSTL